MNDIVVSVLVMFLFWVLPSVVIIAQHIRKHFGDFHGISKSDIIDSFPVSKLKYRANKNFVYCIINPINSKKYIGLTRCGIRRFYGHLREYYKLDKKFYNELKTDGVKLRECHIVILYEGNDVERVEIEMIKKYDTYNNGYNKTRGGESGGNKKKWRVTCSHSTSSLQKNIKFPKRQTEMEEIQDIRNLNTAIRNGNKTIKTFVSIGGVRTEIEIPIV